MEKNVIYKTQRQHAGAVPLDFTDAVSMTVPDQAYTVQEIVERFTRSGVALPERDMIFLGEEEVPNWEFMTRIEQLEYAASLRHLVATRRAELRELEARGESVSPEEYPDLTEREPAPDFRPDPPPPPDRAKV